MVTGALETSDVIRDGNLVLAAELVLGVALSLVAALAEMMRGAT